MSRIAVGKCLLALSVLWAGGRLAAQDDKARQLTVTVGKSLVIDSPVNIPRVSVGNDLLAEAMPCTPRQLAIPAQARGDTPGAPPSRAGGGGGAAAGLRRGYRGCDKQYAGLGRGRRRGCYATTRSVRTRRSRLASG
mgnify:CR=1 FL=1